MSLHRCPCSRWLRILAAASLAVPASGQAATQATQPKPQFTGRVIDENGKPLAGAAITILTGDEFVDTVAMLAKPLAVTDAAGRYATEAPATFTWGSLVAAANGRQSCARQIVLQAAGAGAAVDDLLLMPGAKLSGRVRDELGAPLAGARIRVESSVNDQYSWQLRLLAGARSDASGIFSVPCIARTGLRITVEADGYLAETRLVAQDSAVELSLQKVGMVRGKVVDAAGKPRAGVDVTVVTAERRPVTSGVSSGPDGSFAITVPGRSRFRLSASLSNPSIPLSSGLLRGPADDVVVAPVSGTPVKSLQVVVIDAATKALIPHCQLSVQWVKATDLQTALFHHSVSRRAYEGRATIVFDHQPGKPQSLVVEAPGHAFEVVPVPGSLDEPVTVAMGPEAVLVGRVTDEATGKPMAGVAVRAMPKGNSSGSGGTAENAGPKSDADGNYRIGGLRAGDYVVQTHAAQRSASRPAAVTVALDKESRLDVTVPKEQWLEFELTGEVPDGLAFSLSIGDGMATSSTGGFQHYFPPPGPVPLIKAGRYRLGPVASGTAMLQLFAPSRTRIGSGTTIRLGEVIAGAPPVTIALPDLAIHQVKGHVELPAEVPAERVGVLATMAGQKENRFASSLRPTVAGIGGDGWFTIDLPVGAYCLQCVDLLTGIVFHTEDEDLAVGADTKPVTLRPVCRWLEIECQPQQAGSEVVMQSFQLELPRPRDGAYGAFLSSYGRSNNRDNGAVDFTGGLQRWLVPADKIDLKAYQTFGMLPPWSEGFRSTEIGHERIEVAHKTQKLTFTVPPPPSDEELLRRKD